MKTPENPGSISFIKEEHAKFLPEKTHHIIESYRDKLSTEAEIDLAKWCEDLSSNRPFEEKLLALSRSKHPILRYIAAENLLELCSDSDETVNQAGENFSKINIALLALEGTKKENDGKQLQLLIKLSIRAANIFVVLFNDPLTAIRYLCRCREYHGTLGKKVPKNIETLIKTITKELINNNTLLTYCYNGSSQKVVIFGVDIVAFVTTLLDEKPLQVVTRTDKMNYTCEQMVHYLYMLRQVFDIGRLLNASQATALRALLDKYKAHHEQFSLLPLGALNSITREQFGECSLSGFSPYCYQLYTDIKKAEKLLNILRQLGIKQVTMRVVCQKYAVVYYLSDNLLTTLKQLEESCPKKIKSLKIDGINYAASDESGQTRKLKLDFTVEIQNPFITLSESVSCSILIPRGLRIDLIHYIKTRTKSEKPFVKNVRCSDEVDYFYAHIVDLVYAAYDLLRATGLDLVSPEIYLENKNGTEFYDLPSPYHAVLQLLSDSYKSFEATQPKIGQPGTRGEFMADPNNKAYQLTKKLKPDVKARVAHIVSSLDSIIDKVQFDCEKAFFRAFESADGKICAALKCKNLHAASVYTLQLEQYRPARKREIQKKSPYILIPDIENIDIKKCTI